MPCWRHTSTILFKYLGSIYPHKYHTSLSLGLFINPILQAQVAHKSIRQFTDQTIDDALLKQLVQCTQGAASSSFTQAYSLVQVTNKDNRKKLLARELSFLVMSLILYGYLIYNRYIKKGLLFLEKCEQELAVDISLKFSTW